MKGDNKFVDKIKKRKMGRLGTNFKIRTASNISRI